MIGRPAAPGQSPRPASSREAASAGVYVSGLVQVLNTVPADAVDAVVDRLVAGYNADRSVYLFGNGGSAALASHAACDLGKGTAAAGQRRFRVLSLTDNASLLTAWANDADYQDVFSEQLRNFAVPGDISFAISGSGNSPNILKALEVSRDLGAYNIGVTGFDGGKMKPLCDLCVVVPSTNMQYIEDAHVAITHAIFIAMRAHICKPIALATSAR